MTQSHGGGPLCAFLFFYTLHVRPLGSFSSVNTIEPPRLYFYFICLFSFSAAAAAAATAFEWCNVSMTTSHGHID